MSFGYSKNTMSTLESWKRQLVTVNGQLACPICEKPYEEKKIYQCQNGHLLCKNCLFISKCRACKAPTSDGSENIRNRTLEDILENSSFISLTGLATELRPKQPESSSSSKHTLIQCSACSSQVRSTETWYKCLSCPKSKNSYCNLCIETGQHDDHCTLRIDNDAMAESAKLWINTNHELEGARRPMLTARRTIRTNNRSPSDHGHSRRRHHRN